MKTNGIVLLYVAIVVLSGVIFHSLSLISLILIFAIIIVLRWINSISTSLSARLAFCLHLGCSAALIVKVWQQYGWLPGIFSLFGVLFFLSIWTPASAAPSPSPSAQPELPDHNAREKGQGKTLLTSRRLESALGFFTPGSTRGKGITIWHLPDIIDEKTTNDSSRETWRMAFIETIFAVIPDGARIAPVSLGNADLDRRFDWSLTAFRKTGSGQFGLRYKSTCIQFSPGWLTAIAIVENTCRNDDWYTLQLIPAMGAVEISFSYSQRKPESLYSFAILLAEAWDVPLTQRYANHN